MVLKKLEMQLYEQTKSGVLINSSEDAPRKQLLSKTKRCLTWQGLVLS